MDTAFSLASGVLSPLGTAAKDPVEADKLKREQRFAELLAETKQAEAALAEITKNGAKGYWEWKIKELRKQLTEKVMGEMNLTPEKLAAMSAKERVATENKISDMVEEQLKLAINEEMKRKRKLEISFNATTQAMLAAQEIMKAS